MILKIVVLLLLAEIKLSCSEDQVSVSKADGEKDEVVWSIRLPAGLTWWKLDMQTKHRVSQIHILWGNDSKESVASNNITLTVLSPEGEEKVCLYAVETLALGRTHNLTCVDQPKHARYVIIKALAGTPVTEMKVFALKIDSQDQSTNPSAYLMPEAYVAGDAFTSEQCGTWSNHHSNLAIDGIPSTYSVACVTCDQTLSGGPGWWRLDMGRIREVTGLSVFSSLDAYNSMYINDLQIWVGNTKSIATGEANLCYDFSSDEKFTPGHRFDFRCFSAPLVGRFVTIQRKREARFRPDALAIAEVKILEKTDQGTLTTISNGIDRNQAPEKKAITATQSGTWNNQTASLALDKDPSTWSMADTSQSAEHKGRVAWWQADLGDKYAISRLSITTSPAKWTSEYLRGISVDVSNTSISESFDGFLQCSFHQETTSPGQDINLTCVRPLCGRYVIIRRLSSVEFDPERLPLAEVRITYE